MSCLIMLERACNSVELRKIMELDARLESTGMDSDTRIPLDCATITIGEVGGQVAVSVHGRIYGEEFAASAVTESVGSSAATLTDVLCKNLKVDDIPF